MAHPLCRGTLRWRTSFKNDNFTFSLNQIKFIIIFITFLLPVLVAANVISFIFISLFFAGNEFESRLILMELALLKSGILIFVNSS